MEKEGGGLCMPPPPQKPQEEMEQYVFESFLFCFFFVCVGSGCTFLLFVFLILLLLFLVLLFYFVVFVFVCVGDALTCRVCLRWFELFFLCSLGFIIVYVFLVVIQFVLKCCLKTWSKDWEGLPGKLKEVIFSAGVQTVDFLFCYFLVYFGCGLQTL